MRTQACIGIAEGHTESVGAVAWPFRKKRFAAGSSPWMVTGSRDKTLKVRCSDCTAGVRFHGSLWAFSSVVVCCKFAKGGIARKAHAVVNHCGPKST